jgi:hypothetical protein
MTCVKCGNCDKGLKAVQYNSEADSRKASHRNFLFISVFNQQWDHARVAQLSRCCVTNRKVAGSIPAGVSGFFIDIKFFRSHYGPGVDLASNRNEYREYFLGVKAAGA